MPAMDIDILLPPCFRRLRRAKCGRAIAVTIDSRASAGIRADDSGLSGGANRRGVLAGRKPAFVDSDFADEGRGGGGAAEGGGGEGRGPFAEVGGTFAGDGTDAVCAVEIAGPVAAARGTGESFGWVEEAH